MPDTLHNEPALLELLRAGDPAAFTQLYRHYSVRLYYNILKMVKDETTAEELVQEIFAAIWQSRSIIPADAHFGNYLFASSRNRVYNFFKSLKREHALYARLQAIASESYDPIEEALLARENNDFLQKAIATLPPQRRRVFELVKLEGLSYQAASEQMGVSLSTIKDHMARARETLRDWLADNPETLVGLTFFLFWK